MSYQVGHISSNSYLFERHRYQRKDVVRLILHYLFREMNRMRGVYQWLIVHESLSQIIITVRKNGVRWILLLAFLTMILWFHFILI